MVRVYVFGKPVTSQHFPYARAAAENHLRHFPIEQIKQHILQVVFPYLVLQLQPSHMRVFFYLLLRKHFSINPFIFSTIFMSPVSSEYFFKRIMSEFSTASRISL